MKMDDFALPLFLGNLYIGIPIMAYNILSPSRPNCFLLYMFYGSYININISSGWNSHLAIQQIPTTITNNNLLRYPPVKIHHTNQVADIPVLCCRTAWSILTSPRWVAPVMFADKPHAHSSSKYSTTNSAASGLLPANFAIINQWSPSLVVGSWGTNRQGYNFNGSPVRHIHVRSFRLSNWP